MSVASSVSSRIDEIASGLLPTEDSFPSVTLSWRTHTAIRYRLDCLASALGMPSRNGVLTLLIEEGLLEAERALKERGTGFRVCGGLTYFEAVQAGIQAIREGKEPISPEDFGEVIQ